MDRKYFNWVMEQPKLEDKLNLLASALSTIVHQDEDTKLGEFKGNLAYIRNCLWELALEDSEGPVIFESSKAELQ